MMFSAVSQSDFTFHPVWKQVGGVAAILTPPDTTSAGTASTKPSSTDSTSVVSTSDSQGSPGNGSDTTSSDGSAQNAQDQGKLSVAYTELNELQLAVNQALLGGNPTQAMEAEMEATEIASSIRDLVGSAPSVSMGSIQLATDQLAQLQQGSMSASTTGTSSGTGAASVNAALMPWQIAQTMASSPSSLASSGVTTLAEALNEALAAIASVHLDTRA